MSQRTELRPVPSSTRTAALTAYSLGVFANAAATGYVVLDQLALGGLEEHLDQLYRPVGKYGETAPLYGYLYLIGAVGLLCWWVNIALVRRSAVSARRWAQVTAGAAALPVLAPVVLREYGQPVIPLGLAGGFVLAWIFGVIGAILLRRQS
ncbi:hypothetical protein GCM10027289_24030 [Tsukamurella serpentis]